MFSEAPPPMLTRVLVWGIPELLYGIITSVCSRETDLELIGPMDERMSLMDAVEVAMPDVIIIDQGDNATAVACDQMLWIYPHLRVIGLKKDGREAYLYRLTLEQTALGELSPENLVIAIRRYAGNVPVGGNPIDAFSLFSESTGASGKTGCIGSRSG